MQEGEPSNVFVLKTDMRTAVQRLAQDLVQKLDGVRAPQGGRWRPSNVRRRGVTRFGQVDQPRRGVE